MGEGWMRGDREAFASGMSGVLIRERKMEHHMGRF
jgi:hypothetical protein